MSALLRRRAPWIACILGGRGVTYREVQELVLRAGWADGIVVGEAEAAVGFLLDALAARLPVGAIQVPGLVNLRAGAVSAQPPAQRVPLDSLPLPDFTGLPFPGASLRLYADSGRDFHDAASLATSRWCPHRCAYCYESVLPKNYRIRSLDCVVAEIEAQQAILGTRRVFFCDSTLNVSAVRLRALADRMAGLPRRPRVVFAHCEPRRLDRGMLEALAAAGFSKLNFGLESLDERTLRRMDRDISIAEMQRVLFDAVEAGVSLGLNLVANYPGETEQEFAITVAGVRGLASALSGAAEKSGAGVRFMVSQARVDPHSSLFVNRERFGVRIHRRSIVTPRALQPLRELLESLVLRWEDGTPHAQRLARFAILRSYAESLSITARKRPPSPDRDPRVAIEHDRVPPPIIGLLRRPATAVPSAEVPAEP
jgi:radical SAM superfamily enzyme YgiQ (UPF0313 family)